MNISKNILVIDDEDQANDLQKIAKPIMCYSFSEMEANRCAC